MDKKVRINFILNGKREAEDVIDNLKALFDSEDSILLISKHTPETIKSALSAKMGYDDKWFEENVYCSKFNEVDYDDIKSSPNKKIYLIKMPNSLYHSISIAYNDGFKFVDKTGVAKFIHVFADDCKIISDKYNPDTYEWFMANFSVPFVMDSKMNEGNYAFRKYSPRFVFMSKKYLAQPVSFVIFESKDHFIIDRDVMKHNFDEKIKRLYIPELLMRLHKDGLVKHPSFYPDPVLEQWVERDGKIDSHGDLTEFTKEYSNDEVYIKNILKSSLTIENAVDPLIKEMVNVIKEKLEPNNSEVENAV